MTATDAATRYRNAAAEDAAGYALADLVDIVEALMTRDGGSRPAARRDLDRVAELAHAASRAVRDTDAPWSNIRHRALVALLRDRPLPRLFQLTRTLEGTDHVR